MTFGHLDFSWEHLFITERITNLLFHVICYTFAILYFNEIFEPFVNYHHHSSYWIFSYFWFEMPHLSCVMDWVFNVYLIWIAKSSMYCTLFYMLIWPQNHPAFPHKTHTHTHHSPFCGIYFGKCCLIKVLFSFFVFNMGYSFNTSFCYNIA